MRDPVKEGEAMRLRLRSERGQSATEYMLSISVIAIAIAAAMYTLVGNDGGKPISKSFHRVRGVIEAPYP